jgi:hypothetical protein
MYPKIILTLIISLLMCNGVVANGAVSLPPIMWDFGDTDTTSSDFVGVDFYNSDTNSIISVVKDGIKIEWADGASDYYKASFSASSDISYNFPSTTSSDLVTLNSDHEKIVRDFIAVREINQPAKIRLSGFDPKGTYNIQWITSFQRVDSFSIDVESPNAAYGTSAKTTETITNTVASDDVHDKKMDVRYSNVYTVNSSNTVAEFTFDGGLLGGFNRRFGVSGVVITRASIPEFNNYALLLGCFGLTWVMARRRRDALSH